MGHFNKTVILWSHLDASVLIFNYDAIVDPRLKDGCCKKVPWQEYMALSAAGMRS